MKFKKGKNAQQMGQKGGKKTLKTYGFGHFAELARKKWTIQKWLLTKEVQAIKLKEAKRKVAQATAK